MLPPEVQRIVLLIGLAATGYLMILAWNDDMEAAKTKTEYGTELPLTDSTYATPPEVGSVSSDEQPNVPQPAQQIASEIPQVQEVDLDTATPVVAPAQPSSSADRFVKVTSSNLVLWIDLVGGDVVRTELPEFPVSLEQQDVPFLLLDKSHSQHYVAESGLVGKHGPDAKGRPTYVSEQSEVSIGSGETRSVVLSTQTADGVLVEKIFTVRDGDYLVDVTHKYHNTTSNTHQAALYAQIKRDSRPPTTDESFALAPQPYLGAAFTTPEENYLKIDFDDIDDDGEMRVTEQGGWVAFLQHYFLTAWIAPTEDTNNFRALRLRNGLYLFGFSSPAKLIEAGEVGEWKAQFYAGPKDQKRLEEIAPNLNLTVDYGFLWWVAIPLFYLLDWLYGIVGNWGVAIILLTIVVKALLYPLSAAGYKSMANMRGVAPQMKKLQERYAGDREKLSKEMMSLYQKEGANPLGGCIPMLLPMPIFIALYWVLFESVELRQAPFILWIEDLAVMDPFFILPLAMGASMYWMQTLNPQVGDPMQQRMMKMMPIMFTVLFLFFPAGLVLYWLVNNILSVAQQQYVYRKADQAQAAKA